MKFEKNTRDNDGSILVSHETKPELPNLSRNSQITVFQIRKCNETKRKKMGVNCWLLVTMCDCDCVQIFEIIIVVRFGPLQYI